MNLWLHNLLYLQVSNLVICILRLIRGFLQIDKHKFRKDMRSIVGTTAVFLIDCDSLIASFKNN